MNTSIDFTRIDNDSNGNPRYVCSFLYLLTEEEKEVYPYTTRYEHAVKRANKIGGRKYNNKQYGGGIVFSSYNIEDLERRIFEITGKKYKGKYFHDMISKLIDARENIKYVVHNFHTMKHLTDEERENLKKAESIVQSVLNAKG